MYIYVKIVVSCEPKINKINPCKHLAKKSKICRNNVVNM